MVPALQAMTDDTFTLVSIAVAEEARGQGIASVLLAAFEEEVRRRGYSRVRLSVYSDNEPAARAYRKAGWVRQDVDDPHGDHYWKELV